MREIKNVLLVVNPIAGAIDKTELTKEIKKKVVSINASLSIFRTTGEEDIFNLGEKLKEIDPCRIIAAGGDGTIKLVAEALKGKNIPVGIIPAGSANGLAVNLNLPTTLEEQIEIAFGSTLTEMDIILIDDNYCLHMSDFGLNAELIHKYENSNIRGKLGYLLQSIPTLIQSDYPFHFIIEANGKTLEKKGILLGIANAQAYGTGATVNPKGKINDGIFEILLFKNFDFLEILKTLRNEVDLDPEFVEILPVTKAVIRCKSSVAFQIDGEYLGKRQVVEASILPNKLLVAATK